MIHTVSDKGKNSSKSNNDQAPKLWLQTNISNCKLRSFFIIHLEMQSSAEYQTRSRGQGWISKIHGVGFELMASTSNEGKEVL